MPKAGSRSDSTTDAAVGVAAADIESMVQKACQKATELLKVELLKMFTDITARLDSTQQRLDTLEKKVTEYEVALNDVSSRVMDIQGAVDCLEVAGSTAGMGERVQDCLKEIEAVRSEARAAICSANDVEQYGRRNNIRIRGLSLGEGEDCRSAVVSFLNSKLQAHVCADDIEAAHVLPRSEYTENVASAHTAVSSGKKQQGTPMIIVRFHKRELRDSVLRKRRGLKNTRFAIVEDLTLLNWKTLARVSRDSAVASAWTWNGKIHVLKKSGDKLTVKPYQSI